MDVPMRDANRAGAGRRNGASNARAARRSDPYGRESRSRQSADGQQSQRAQEDGVMQQSVQSQVGMSYPPPEFSIRGSSGPTWIVVSNLVVGTSNEDVRLTFSAFGRVEEVKQRPAPSANHPTVAFEVAFDRREDAEQAVDKFNGALADGRILQVSIKKSDVPRDAYSQFSRATAQTAAQRPRERGSSNLIPAPAPLAYAPAPASAVAAAIPTGPASMRSRAHTAQLVEPRAKKSNGNAPSHNPAATTKPATNKPNTKGNTTTTTTTTTNNNNNTAVPTGPKKPNVAASKPKPLAQRIPEPLANRLLTPAQAQKLRAEEAKKKAQQEARAKAIAATGKNTVLGKRLGGLPLAQRLVQQAGTPKSDASAIKAAAEKKKRKREAAKAKKAKKTAAAGELSRMELDG